MAEDRRSKPRSGEERWRTALTAIEPNKILVRGYPLDEMMGRLAFGEAIYLLLVGELPTAGIGKLVEAMLVSFIDHGPTPPSTLAARNVATTGATLRGCVAAGVLGFGRFFGGDIQATMEMLDQGLARVRNGTRVKDAAEEVLKQYRERGELPPGFGHRIHTFDPRAARLFQMAMELELDGEHVRFIRAMEMALHERPSKEEQQAPVNIDGAIAAVCGDLGIKAEVADGLFMISRIPGIVAHALEEHERHEPLRRIDPQGFVYDGPAQRRLPETRRV
ncbi:MAG: citryl-CoA lyase [Acidobacteria bacterium]|nr:citryl-CoA lyase [Acidobacteriota bacterium]